MTPQEFLTHLEDVEGHGKGRWSAKCPCHEDYMQSLSVIAPKGAERIKLECSKGCSTFKIVQAMGLTLKALSLDAGGEASKAASSSQTEGVQQKKQAGSQGKKEIQRLEIISAPDLQKANLPPIKYLVDGILPEGTSLLSAASKIGKSWMALDLGLCLASGQPFLGHNTNQAGVLYLALEDSLQRLQGRMETVWGKTPAPPLFDFTTKAPRLDMGLLDALDDHLQRKPDTRLFIIDTLQKIRGQSLFKEAAYTQDYREMGVVKEFMDKAALSVLFLHHNRKMRDDGDPFNMISGTNGIMGAADTVWTITKDRRDSDETVLHITGRDVIQSDTAIRFDRESCIWKPLGAVDWLAEQQARMDYNQSPIVKTIKTLLEQSPAHRWDGTAKDLMEAGKYIARTYLSPSTKKLGRDIIALEKSLFEYDGIVHATSSHGTAGKKHSFYYQNFGQFEELPDDGQQELPWQIDSEK